MFVELEELPRLRLVAETFEDESRLRTWLESPRVRERLLDAIEDAMERAAA